MPLPTVLIVLAVMALVLHIVFNYWVPAGWPATPQGRAVLAAIIVILILIFWFVLPIRVGPGA